MDTNSERASCGPFDGLIYSLHPLRLLNIYLFKRKLNQATHSFSSQTFWEERRRSELLARRQDGGGDHVTEQRRVNWACHFSFVFTCRRSAEDGRRDGERRLDGERFGFGQAARQRTDWFVVGRQVEDYGSCSPKEKPGEKTQSRFHLKDRKLLWNYLSERPS